MNTVLRVGLIQQTINSSAGKIMDRTITGIEQAAAQGAQLVVLQELHNSAYFCQSEDTHNFDLAEPIPGPSSESLAQVARKHDLVIVSSLFEKRGKGLFHNTAVVLERDGSIAGMYRKMHIPDDPGYYEKFYFTPGDLGFQPISTSLGKLGILICWDQWFPEAARLMALAGADMLIIPTAIGWDPCDASDEKQRQLEAWTTVQRAHAVANGLPLICCNRSGFEEDPSGQSAGIDFWGNSFVCGPQGEMLAKATAQGEAILMGEIDLDRVEQVRRTWPFLRDRRIDSFADLCKRYRD